MVPNSSGHGGAYLPGELSLRDLLTVVFKRRWLIVVFTVVRSWPVSIHPASLPIYEVEATLLVNKARAEIPIAPKESTQLIVSQVSEQDLNSEIQILKSRQLLEEALRDPRSSRRPPEAAAGLTGLKAQIRALMGPELSLSDRMVLAFKKKLEYRWVRKSNVIRVSYRSKDPEWATRVVGL